MNKLRVLAGSIVLLGLSVTGQAEDHITVEPDSPVKLTVPNKAKVKKGAVVSSKGAVTAPSKPYAEGEAIVRFKKGTGGKAVDAIAGRESLKIVRFYHGKSQKGLTALVKSAKPTEALMDTLKNDPNVEAVSPNYIRHLDAVANDPLFTSEWGLNNTGQDGGTYDADIDAAEAWDVKKGSPEVVVAVFDTGVDYTHADLQANLWVNPGEIPGNGIDDDGNGYVDDVYGYDMASDSLGNNDGDPMDVHGHGTHVSGTIGATGNNTYGVTGVNWDVKVMNLKIFAPGEDAYDSDILEAIDYIKTMKRRGVNIVAVNASYGGTGGDQTDPMNAAIQELGDMGIVFCAAAGNDGTDNDTAPQWPSSYDADNIISVASTDRNDALSSFSNYGATSVDIAAPGSSIVSTMKYKVDYVPASGDPYFMQMDGSGSWYVDANSTWGLSTANAHSAPYSRTDSPAGDYPNNVFTYIYPQVPIDLTGIANNNLAFGFWAVMDLETDYDYFHVYFSADGGEHWALMKSYTGYGLSMQSYSIEIPDSYQTDSFLYLLAVQSDSTNTADGVYIDDIGIGVGTRTSNRFASWSGTSMATPHVTGAIGLMASAYHGESGADRIRRILDGGDALPALSGKVVTNARLNVNNAIRLLLSEQPCPVNMHRDQGTGSCIAGEVTEYPGVVPSREACPAGQHLAQGTGGCIAGTAEPDQGAYPAPPPCEHIQGGTACTP